MTMLYNWLIDDIIIIIIITSGTRELKLLTLILSYGSLLAVAFVNISSTVLPWQHFC